MLPRLPRVRSACDAEKVPSLCLLLVLSKTRPSLKIASGCVVNEHMLVTARATQPRYVITLVKDGEWLLISLERLQLTADAVFPSVLWDQHVQASRG